MKKFLLSLLSVVTLAFASHAAPEPTVIEFTKNSTAYPSNSAYTGTWKSTDGVWSFTAFNNNNKGWDFIAAGRKSYASTPTVATLVGSPAPIESIVATVAGRYSKSAITGATLYVADNADFTGAKTTNITSLAQSAAANSDLTIEVNGTSAGEFVKVEFELASQTSNGMALSFSKIAINYSDGAVSEPDGSAENPYRIATAEDLCNAYKLTKADEMVYFIQTADIDMSDVKEYTPFVGYTSSGYNRPLNYDGQNHLIKNFAPTTDEFVADGMYCYGQSIFGVFSGELKNLGIVDMKLNAAEGRCGAIGGYLGQSSANIAVTKVSNVFVTGEVNGGSNNYAGGMFGTTGTDVEITNCFVNVKVTGTDKSLAGGLAGRLNNPTTLKNVYVAGEVSGVANLLSGTDKGTVTAQEVILFNTGSEKVSANNIAVIVATADDREDLADEVMEWPGFSDTKMVYGLPGLESFNYSVIATETVSSVKETIALATKTPVVINYALTVGFVSNSNVFACDAAGDFIQLYGPNSLKVGDVIPAGWNATYELYNNVTPELTGFTLPAATAGTFTPAEVAAANISTDLVNSVVLVKNVTFEEATPATKDNFNGVADGVVLSFRNNYTLASVEAGVYDVTIVVTIYNGTPSLYVVNYESAEPDGSAAHPYEIATAEDLCNAYKLTKANELVYFIQTADIDMSDVTDWHALVGFDNVTYSSQVNYDGQNHLIKNFTSPNEAFAAGKDNCYNGSIFGVLNGVVKNLGIVDCNINTPQGGGAIAGYGGHGSGTTATIENVFVTGTIKGTNYLGGLVGTNGNAVIIRNCYVNATVESTGCVAGIVGRLRSFDANEFENVYAAGTVNGEKGALFVSSDKTGVVAKGKNLIAFNTGVENATIGTADLNVEVATAANKAELVDQVKAWEAFSDTKAVYGLPALESFDYEAVIPVALTELWKTPQLMDYNGNWTNANVTWADGHGTMATSNTRFATAYDGVIYTINQATQSIAKVTDKGLVDVYALPTPLEATDFYGCGIAVDEVGNFLIDMNYTKRPSSCLNWFVYSPATGEGKQFVLPAPEGITLGRVDCVGDVLGDLTKEAYFFITPEKAYSNVVRVIKVTGDGTVKGAEMTELTDVTVEGNFTQQNIAVPAYGTLEAAKAADALTDFYYSSCDGTDNYYAEYINGTLTSNFAPAMLFATYAGNNGFATFTVEGKRYFVRNYEAEKTTPPARPMSLVIMDEEGNIVTTWENEEFVRDGGYSTIIARPKSDNTVDIFIYNSCNKLGGAAAALNFNPAYAGDPIIVDLSGTKYKPYAISTPEDLVAMRDKIIEGDTYFTIENDIDMAGVAYSAPLGNNNFTGRVVHIDGKQHIIKNLTCAAGDYPSLIGVFMGEIRNLGMENANITTSWGGGVFGGFVGHTSYAGTTVIDNCFVTGNVKGGGDGYVGAFGGYTNGKLSITNSYAAVNVSGGGQYGSGAAIGWSANGTINMENVYVRGSVTGAKNAVGLAHGTGSITLNNVAVWSPALTGSTGAYAYVAGGMTVNATNLMVWDGTLINGVPAANGVSAEKLQTTITGWEAFNKDLCEGYPVLAWQDANTVTYGTEENPYPISTPQDLLALGNVITGEKFYAVVENDIDMTGTTYATVAPISFVYLDGQNHIISNATLTGATGGLFTDFSGVIKNLGLENVTSVAKDQWGTSGTFTAYSVDLTLENCFATGSTNGFYSGGLVGGVKGKVNIKDCYAATNVTSGNGYAGGLVGALNAGVTVSVENAYASGAVEGVTIAAGLVAGHNVTFSGGTLTMTNVAAWNPTVTCAVVEKDGVDVTRPAATVYNAAGNLTVVENNVMVWDGMIVNGTKVAEGVTAAKLQETITAWEAYNDKLNDGYPVLAWQEANGETTGIEAVTVDVNADAVYYNLQGVRVANPENGIYIVRRGNTVTKELIRK